MSFIRAASSDKTPWSLVVLFVTWVIGTSITMFLLERKDLRLFYENQQGVEVFFEGGKFSTELAQYIEEQQLQQQGSIYIFHFWNPNCICDQANSEHVKQIISNYAVNIIFFLVANANDYSAYLEQWKDVIPYGRIKFISYEELQLTTDLPATPAAAVVSPSGKLNYFGPYSEGGVCLPNDEGIIEGILDSILIGESKYYPFTTGYGCYCPWQKE